jgi:hypothetical protein
MGICPHDNAVVRIGGGRPSDESDVGSFASELISSLSQCGSARARNLAFCKHGPGGTFPERE